MSAVQSSSVWNVVKSECVQNLLHQMETFGSPVQLWYDAAKWYQPVLQRQERKGVIINCVNVYKDTPKTFFVNPREKREWINGQYLIFEPTSTVQNKLSECENNWQASTGKYRSILEWNEKGRCDLQNAAKGRLVTYLNTIDRDLWRRR